MTQVGLVESHESAISVRIQLSSHGGQGSHKNDSRGSDGQIDVSVLPLHLFADLRLLSGDGTSHSRNGKLLEFVQEISGRPSTSQRHPQTDSTPTSSGPHQDEEDEPDKTDDDSTPPSTPQQHRTIHLRLQQKEREKERKRLERLVLEDLDLSMNYLPKEPISSPPKPSPGIRSKRKVRF